MKFSFIISWWPGDIFIPTHPARPDIAPEVQRAHHRHHHRLRHHHRRHYQWSLAAREDEPRRGGRWRWEHWNAQHLWTDWSDWSLNSYWHWILTNISPLGPQSLSSQFDLESELRRRPRHRDGLGLRSLGEAVVLPLVLLVFFVFPLVSVVQTGAITCGGAQIKTTKSEHQRQSSSSSSRFISSPVRAHKMSNCVNCAKNISLNRLISQSAGIINLQLNYLFHQYNFLTV